MPERITKRQHPKNSDANPGVSYRSNSIMTYQTVFSSNFMTLSQFEPVTALSRPGASSSCCC